MDATEEAEQKNSEETTEQPELVPAHELTDGQVITLCADNGRPFPESRGVFRVKLD